MAIAKGMTDREWVIHEKARCLQCLLSSVMESVDDMRTSMIVSSHFRPYFMIR